MHGLLVQARRCKSRSWCCCAVLSLVEHPVLQLTEEAGKVYNLKGAKAVQKGQP